MRDTLKEDLEFFKKKNIIDYSMLVGVGDDDENLSNQFSATSADYSDEDTRGDESISMNVMSATSGSTQR